MFIDKGNVGVADYLCLLCLLNAVRATGNHVGTEVLMSRMKTLMKYDEAIESTSRLWDLHLVYFSDANGESAAQLEKGGNIGLGWLGLAFLTNYANEYIQRIVQLYGEMPEDLLATLTPYLDLSTAQAADRYVSTKESPVEFQALQGELEVLCLELIRIDQDQLVPVRGREAVVRDLNGALAQLKGGYVKLSELTIRVRPLVRLIGNAWRENAVIGTATHKAYQIIDGILQKRL